MIEILAKVQCDEEGCDVTADATVSIEAKYVTSCEEGCCYDKVMALDLNCVNTPSGWLQRERTMYCPKHSNLEGYRGKKGI